MNIEELRSAQADIRDIQRRRLDNWHAELHEIDRDFYRLQLESISEEELLSNTIDRISKIHQELHEFMHGFDRAIMIHEAIAKLNGDDPTLVTRALLKVRTEGI